MKLLLLVGILATPLQAHTQDHRRRSKNRGDRLKRDGEEQLVIQSAEERLHEIGILLQDSRVDRFYKEYLRKESRKLKSVQKSCTQEIKEKVKLDKPPARTSNLGNRFRNFFKKEKAIDEGCSMNMVAAIQMTAAQEHLADWVSLKQEKWIIAYTKYYHKRLEVPMRTTRTYIQDVVGNRDEGNKRRRRNRYKRSVCSHRTGVFIEKERGVFRYYIDVSFGRSVEKAYKGTSEEDTINQIIQRKKQMFLKATELWMKKTCIRFEEADREEEADILIQDMETGECSIFCSQNLGQAGDETADMETSGCTYVGQILHELGHILGLDHEQSRPDRDDYIVVWDSDENLAGFSSWTQPGISETKTFSDFCESCVRLAVGTLGIGYAYDSIMHYGAFGHIDYTGRDEKKYTVPMYMICPRDPRFTLIIGSAHESDDPVLPSEDIAAVNRLHCTRWCSEDRKLDEIVGRSPLWAQSHDGAPCSDRKCYPADQWHEQPWCNAFTGIRSAAAVESAARYPQEKSCIPTCKSVLALVGPDKVCENFICFSGNLIKEPSGCKCHCTPGYSGERCDQYNPDKKDKAVLAKHCQHKIVLEKGKTQSVTLPPPSKPGSDFVALDCSYWIQAPAGMYVALVVHQVSLGRSEFCWAHYIQINEDICPNSGPLKYSYPHRRRICGLAEVQAAAKAKRGRQSPYFSTQSKGRDIVVLYKVTPMFQTDPDLSFLADPFLITASLVEQPQPDSFIRMPLPPHQDDKFYGALRE